MAIYEVAIPESDVAKLAVKEGKFLRFIGPVELLEYHAGETACRR
tara:strand:- start:260 stop:394 length:135 start_codon:yes stop_codon:yes gene_type:complete